MKQTITIPAGQAFVSGAHAKRRAENYILRKYMDNLTAEQKHMLDHRLVVLWVCLQCLAEQMDIIENFKVFSFGTRKALLNLRAAVDKELPSLSNQEFIEAAGVDEHHVYDCHIQATEHVSNVILATVMVPESRSDEFSAEFCKLLEKYGVDLAELEKMRERMATILD